MKIIELHSDKHTFESRINYYLQMKIKNVFFFVLVMMAWGLSLSTLKIIYCTCFEYAKSEKIINVINAAQNHLFNTSKFIIIVLSFVKCTYITLIILTKLKELEYIYMILIN